MDGTKVKPNLRFKMRQAVDTLITNGEGPAEFWILEGKPIGEKQARFGPVILKDLKEVREGMDEIRIKEFQEWPWKVMDCTNPIDMGRELHRKDGTVETP